MLRQEEKDTQVGSDKNTAMLTSQERFCLLRPQDPKYILLMPQ